MAMIDFETKCPCGHMLRGSMKKPTLIVASIQPITCGKCGSRFLMTSKRIRGKAGRLIHTEIEIINQTKLARDIVASKLPGVTAKVAKMVGLGKPDTADAIVETEMDNPIE